MKAGTVIIRERLELIELVLGKIKLLDPHEGKLVRSTGTLDVWPEENKICIDEIYMNPRTKDVVIKP